MLYLPPKMDDIKYILSAFGVVPLLPLMYFQGKRIRASVPKLPPAAGPEGLVEMGSGTPIRIITIGESTIDGIGVDTHESGFTGSFAKSLSERTGQPVKWTVYARSGYTAARTTAKLLPRIKEKEIDLIVIGLGGNDAFALKAPWLWRRDIKALIEALRSNFPDTPIAFLNMPPIKLFPAFTTLIKKVVGNHVELLGRSLKGTVASFPGVYYNEERITFENWTERLSVSAPFSAYFSDGVHPSGLTYQTWATDMARYVHETGILNKP